MRCAAYWGAQLTVTNLRKGHHVKIWKKEGSNPRQDLSHNQGKIANDADAYPTFHVLGGTPPWNKSRVFHTFHDVPRLEQYETIWNSWNRKYIAIGNEPLWLIVFNFVLQSSNTFYSLRRNPVLQHPVSYPRKPTA